MQTIKQLFFGLCIFGNLTAFGQVDRPKASPYTVQGTYEHLKKNHSFIKPLDLPKPTTIGSDENIVYSTIDTLSLKADIYYPINKKEKSAAVVLVHGGGWISGSKENQHYMAQQLAANGYVAMTINYRLADVAKYPGAIIDIENAVKYLKDNKKKYNINTSKTVVLGASAGAQLATLVGVKKENKIAAIINVDGITSFIHPEAEEGQYAAYWLGSWKKDNPDVWKEASPLEYVGKHTPPTLFINSSQPRFHAGRDQMISVLNDHKIYSEVHEIKDSPHSFWLVQPWFDETLSITVNFLDKLLK